ncbi:hypothetical protein [Rathayibacter festucae]|uniref:Uncharacterized protein n=1 Tax=Rathayibacter festucae DSM 15932 TaxID=1328866 RepID=A0A3Q9UYZ5_9MICO|nr:hypothetical protein [Rathayibacter festucae]AZZ52491.1 hypothetical protein C1I64_10835 [Rathayibacter festucae DSM 15932]MCJ1701060.1 hypothetical protein [Rathayibacter festucae]
MIECGSCGTDAVVLDRSGGEDSEGVSSEELVVLCAECAPGEITAALEAALLDEASLEGALPAAALEKAAHARAA